MTPFPLSFLQLIFIIRQSSPNAKADVIHPIIYIYNTLAFIFLSLRFFLMSVVKQYYGFKERTREKRKSVLWETEKMADKGKEISRLWISDWKKYARRHKKNHLKNEN